MTKDYCSHCHKEHINVDQCPPNLLAEHRWDNTSVEAEFHKRLGFLSKKHQGLVMHHFREVLRNQVREKPHKDKDSY